MHSTLLYAIDNKDVGLILTFEERRNSENNNKLSTTKVLELVL